MYQTKPRPGIYYDRQHPSLKGCILYLPFLGAGDFHDYAGTSKLTNNGVLWGVNQSGTVADFSPSNAHFNCGRKITTGLDAITVEVWIKTTGISEHILNNDSTESALYLTVTGTGYFEMGINTVAGVDGVYTTSAFNDGEWHHVVGMWESGTRTVLYVDGVIPSSTSYGASRTGILVAGDDNLFIGGRPWIPLAADYTGELGYVAIYNRKLSFIELRDRYANPWAAWKPNTPEIWAAISPAGSTFSPWLVSNNNIMI